MRTSRERVLVVESDPDISDLIARQTLQSVRYRVRTARSAGTALQEAKNFSPDVIITNLNLPGLSGKDLLVALFSQGIDTPVIVMAGPGMEADMIQAFRLGAADALILPVREAEVVTAVERVLKQLRARRERDALAQELQATNIDLQKRLKESQKQLNTVLAIGKTLSGATDLQDLYQKAVEGAVYLADADLGWVLVREEQSQMYLLGAQVNLPAREGARPGQYWDDGLSSLVAMSGKPLSLSGEDLENFKTAELGKAALVAPMKVRRQLTGVLGVLRKDDRPFTPGEQKLLEDICDFAAIAIRSLRRSQAVETRMRSLQQAVNSSRSSEEKKDALLAKIQKELQPPLLEAIDTVNNLLVGEGPRLNVSQKGVLRATERKLKEVSRIIETVDPFRQRT